ncbi:MAG: lamin tail domain-containing protein, partial [Verrucomicrobiales bacterium]|nr:lamin tail domain-containing protein [Verrucomicrobiales bacterium]
MTAPKSPTTITAAALLLLSAAASHSAPITWSAPVNITSDSDIDTSGTLHTAINTTSDEALRIVTIGAETITFNNAINVGPTTTSTGTFFTGGGGSTGNTDLDAVLNSHTYGSDPWSFELDGLTAGRQYQLQLVGGGDTRGCCDNRNQRAGDGETPESLSADFSRSGPGSVIGTFTADATTQAINILPGEINGIDPSLSLYVVRDLTSAGSLPPTDVALSNTDLSPNTPTGTTIGTLNAEDPNPTDTHTFTLHDNANFPDNTRFTIAGNQLKSASALGSFGTTYSVNIRATDPGGLSFTKPLTLTVEAAQPPVSVSADSNTIPLGSPAGTTVATLSTNDPNQADSHNYTLVDGPGSTDNASFTIDGTALNLAVAAPAPGTALSLRVRSTDLSDLSVESVLQLSVTSVSLRINEFLADGSSSSVNDEDGDPSDWLELFNPESTPTSLAGLYLTDDPNNLTKWPFPTGTSVPARGYLLVFASAKNRTTSPLHTNFNLNAGGEFLALVGADGTTLLTSFGSADADFPSQRSRISYGFFDDPVKLGYMLTPTPGAANNNASGTLGFVADTKFDHDRGFYDAPFNLAITSTTPDATIRYTTDGSWPSESNGNVYSSPLTISSTTTLKAVATKPGFLPTNTDTHTYIFVDDVVAQTSASTRTDFGFPNRWGSNTVYYGMNNNRAVNPATHPTIKEDLKAIPSLVIGMDVEDMFGRRGIYSNPQSSGISWERQTSFEIIDPNTPDGGLDHQQNCAIRIQGGAFRSFGLTRKKSFRVIFKSQFGTANQPTNGPGKLRYPLFSHIDPDASEKFDTLVFRMESNDGWQWGGANGQPQYARDEWGRRSQLALGHPAGHGRYMHIYINGAYWGVYNVVERPDASFAENYLGADPDTWQGQNSGTPINSATNIREWTTMLSHVDDISRASTDSARDAEYLEAYGFNADGTRNPNLPIWIDATNFIDYLLVNWYAGNSDWSRKNYYGGRDPSPDSTGYKFFMWDAEWSLLLRSSLTTDKTSDFAGIGAPQQHLARSPEYQVRYGDRVHRAFFNNGPLSPENCAARYAEITSQHTSILVPEAARWGNQHNQSRSVRDWENEANKIIRTWFPGRGDRFISQLRRRKLYPSIEAPIYSQHGGSVSTNQGVSLAVPAETEHIYYMVGDGDTDPTDYAHSLDPRLVGGTPNPSATLIDFTAGGGSTPPTELIAAGSSWRYLGDGSDQGTGWRQTTYDDSTWKSGATELGYGEADQTAPAVDWIDTDPDTGGPQRNATTYFRTTFDVTNPSAYSSLKAAVLYDDGVAVYVNGTEILRSSNLPANAAYDTYSNGSTPNENTFFEFADIPPSVLVLGTNTIAAEIHQSSAGSSDIAFNLSLNGTLAGGGNISKPVFFSSPKWLFSRAYDPASGDWSALNTAYFSIDSTPADNTNLVVSELNYHPYEPVAQGEIAVSTDRDDYEFIELLNTRSDRSLDLTGVRFNTGINYAFPDNTFLPAGARLVLARDTAAYNARYPGAPAPFAAYTGRLSNDGEQIVLSSAAGTIHDFTYNDQLPWPESADGTGPSLGLISPDPTPDHNAPTSWSAAAPSPGTDTSTDDDNDHDGLSALLELALGTSDDVPNFNPFTTDTSTGNLTVTFPFSIAAD